MMCSIVCNIWQVLPGGNWSYLDSPGKGDGLKLSPVPFLPFLHKFLALFLCLVPSSLGKRGGVNYDLDLTDPRAEVAKEPWQNISCFLT